MNEIRLEILRRVEEGKLSIQEASNLLVEVENEDNWSDFQQSNQSFEKKGSIKGEIVNQFEKPKWLTFFWIVPVFLGVFLTVFSGLWMYQNYQSSGLGFKFWLTGIPLFFGILLIYLGWASQKSKWIYLNIWQPEGEKPRRIFLVFPLPFQLAGFFIKIFKNYLPEKISTMNIEEMIMDFDQQITQNEPIFVHVDDTDGTRVEVFIG